MSQVFFVCSLQLSGQLSFSGRIMSEQKEPLLLCPADLSSRHVAVITLAGLVRGFSSFFHSLLTHSFHPSTEDGTQTNLSETHRGAFKDHFKCKMGGGGGLLNFLNVKLFFL